MVYERKNPSPLSLGDQCQLHRHVQQKQSLGVLPYDGRLKLEAAAVLCIEPLTKHLHPTGKRV